MAESFLYVFFKKKNRRVKNGVSLNDNSAHDKMIDW